MSSNAPGPTFDPNEPRQALGLLDALLSQDSMNFNRATHNAIQRAVATLSGVMDARDGLAGQIETQKAWIAILQEQLEEAKKVPALALVDPPPDTAEPETGSNAQSAS